MSSLLRADSPYIVIPVADEAAAFWQASYMSMLLHFTTMMQFFVPICLEPTAAWVDGEGLLSYLASDGSDSYGIAGAQHKARTTRPTTAAPTSTDTPTGSPRAGMPSTGSTAEVNEGGWQLPRKPIKFHDVPAAARTKSKGAFDILECSNYDSEPAVCNPASAHGTPTLMLCSTAPGVSFETAIAEHDKIVEATPALRDPPVSNKRPTSSFAGINSRGSVSSATAAIRALDPQACRRPMASSANQQFLTNAELRAVRCCSKLTRGIKLQGFVAPVPETTISVNAASSAVGASTSSARASSATGVTDAPDAFQECLCAVIAAGSNAVRELSTQLFEPTSFAMFGPSSSSEPYYYHEVVGTVAELMASGLDEEPPKHCFLCASCWTYYGCACLSNYSQEDCLLGMAPEHGCYTSAMSGEAVCELCLAGEDGDNEDFEY